MTTRNSPRHLLKNQADQMAATIKKAERGDFINARFAEKIRVARAEEVFKVGIVMDDQVITIDLPWEVIKSSSEAELASYILQRMQGKPE